MPVTKAKPRGKPSKVQAAPSAASEPAQSAAPAPKAREAVATVTPEQRAKLEGTTLRKRKKAPPIPEIDSTPVRPKYARRGRPKKGETPLNETELQAAATASAPSPARLSSPTSTTVPTSTAKPTSTPRSTIEVVGEVTATLPLEEDLPTLPEVSPQFKGPGAKRLKAIDKAQKTTQSNQVLTQIKAGPRRSSAANTKPQVEQLSAANLGYLDGFISQLQQPKPHAQANTLSTGYSLQDRAQATAAMAPNASARTLSYEPFESYQGPKLTPSPAFFEDDEPAVLPFAPITGAAPRSAPSNAQPPRLTPPRSASRPAASARPSAQPQLLNIDAALEPEAQAHAADAQQASASQASAPQAGAPQAGSTQASFLDQPLSPEIELMVIDPRYESEFALPQYESELAAGIDLRAMFDYDVVLEPNQTMLVPTGIALNMGRSGMCATVLPRSGLGFRQGIVLGNLVGLIDADYQGELMVPLWNRSDTPFTITVGMRIAQLVFLPIIRPHFKRVKKFTPTQRGTKGFGSTNVD